MPAPLPVVVIGRGRIGGPVADWLASAPGYRLADVIGRGGAFPAAPAAGQRLTLETAGPQALAEWGELALAQGDLWSVGAAALLDAGLRERLRTAATRHGHRLRLFTPWIVGPALAPPGAPGRLHIEQSAPGLAPAPGPMFEGTLAQAALRFPHHLNTATAAALTGPGLAATTVALHSSPPGGPHLIRARMDLTGQTIASEVSFSGSGPHPVAQALIAALIRRDGWLRFGTGA